MKPCKVSLNCRNCYGRHDYRYEIFQIEIREKRVKHRNILKTQIYFKAGFWKSMKKQLGVSRIKRKRFYSNSIPNLYFLSEILRQRKVGDKIFVVVKMFV